MSGRWWDSWNRVLVLAGLVAGLAGGSSDADAAKRSRKNTEASAHSASPTKSTSSKNAVIAKGKAAKGRTSAARRTVWTTKVVRGKLVRVAQVRPVRLEPAVLSVGALSGLHAVGDPLELRSGVALVIDQDSNQVLFSKNPSAVLPIASITKLMTAMVVVESGQPLDELLTVEQDDADQTEKSRSRLVPGTTMTRRDMLRLALMSSENRAAQALSRNFPGGQAAFVAAMNRRAQQLEMQDTRFVEATGLSAENRSSALDLSRLVGAASAHELIREFSTARESLVSVGQEERMVHYKSTNGLIGKPEWDISLQKTGYIAAAGRCLVMQAQLAGRRLIMVLLDSSGRGSRFGDAERIRKWLAHSGSTVSAAVAAPVGTVTR